MAFTQIKNARLPRRRNTLPTIHLYTRESRRSADQVETRLRLTLPLLRELGWTVDQRVDVMVGVDEDQGRIQIAANPAGVFRLRKLSTSGTSFVLTSRTIPVPAGINKKVEYSIDEGKLLIGYA
jgi:hypothetical protein